MIKFDKGSVQISGKGVDILAEYAVLTHRIKEMFVNNGGKEEEVNKQLRDSLERGLLSEEEIDKRFKEVMKEPEFAGMLLGVAGLSILFGQKNKED